MHTVSWNLRGGEGHSLAAAAQWEDLCGQQPRHRTPSKSVDNVVKHDERELAVGFSVDGHVSFGKGANDSEKDSH
jgi:hypothetical protein